MKKLKRSEWDFSKVEDSELAACQFFEYARESDRIRKLAADPNRERRFKRVHEAVGWNSLYDVYDAKVHLAQKISRLPDIEGWPDTPWQSLLKRDREDVAEWLPKLRTHQAVRLITRWELEQLIVLQRSEDREHGTQADKNDEVRAQPFAAALHLNWNEYTDEELKDAVGQWIKENRPKKISNPPKPRSLVRKGNYFDRVRQTMQWLGVMRLRHQYTMRSMPTTARKFIYTLHPPQSVEAGLERFRTQVDPENEDHLTKAFYENLPAEIRDNLSKAIRKDRLGKAVPLYFDLFFPLVKPGRDEPRSLERAS